MNRERHANWVFSVALAVTSAALLLNARAPQVNPVLKLEFQRNAVPIRDLDQSRTVTVASTLWLDVLDLSHNGKLAHPVLGDLGWGEHYFIDLKARIRVSTTARYRFEVSSDDGFALAVDDRRICAFTRDRALATQQCGALLTAGEHLLTLRYFQGVGPAALRVRYAVEGEDDLRWLGQDSAALVFLRD